MLIALAALAVLTAAVRAGWSLHRLWSTLPRSNRDFGLV